MLIDECDFKSTDFITSDGVFLFSILKKIKSLGFSVVDEVTILTSMPDNIVESFQKIGGYETIKNITDVVNIQNTEVYIDNLYRENIILKLWDDGFNLIKPVIDTNGKEIIPIKLFRKMDSEGVLDWWESRLSSYGTGYTTKILEDNYLDFDDKYFENMDSGEETGVPFDFAGDDINLEEMRCLPFISNNVGGYYDSTFNVLA